MKIIRLDRVCRVVVVLCASAGEPHALPDVD